MAPHHGLPERGLVRLNQIIAPCGPIPVGRSTWWAGVKNGRFPRPVKLGPGITAWRVEDIQGLIDEGVVDASAPRHESPCVSGHASSLPINREHRRTIPAVADSPDACSDGQPRFTIEVEPEAERSQRSTACPSSVLATSKIRGSRSKC